MRGLVLAMVTFVCLCIARPAGAEQWEFSFGAFGGKAYHANTTGRLNWAGTPGGFEPVDGKAIGLNFDNSQTFGGKLTAWHLQETTSGNPRSAWS
jgi:hypothetical protein